MPPTRFGRPVLAKQSCSLLCKQTRESWSADLTRHVLSSGSFLQREWPSGGREGRWTLGRWVEAQSRKLVEPLELKSVMQNCFLLSSSLAEDSGGEEWAKHGWAVRSSEKFSS